MTTEPERSVYIVTEGEYSSYHIVAVFDSQRHAAAYAKMRQAEYSFSSYRVEEWPLYKAGSQAPVLTTIYVATATINKAGEVVSRNSSSRQDWIPPGSRSWRWNPRAKLEPEVWGVSEAEVEKALSDWIAEIQAWRAGIT